MRGNSSSSNQTDSSRVAVILSAIAIVIAIFQWWTSQEQNEIVRQQVAQLEEFHREDVKRGQRPFVAFARSAILPIRRGDDGRISCDSVSTGAGDSSYVPLQIENLGNGPAIDVELTWMPDEGEFLVAKPESPQMSPEKQSLVDSFPIQVFQNGQTTCRGCVELRCHDIDGRSYSSCQLFHAAMDESHHRVIVSFPLLYPPGPIDWEKESPYTQ